MSSQAQEGLPFFQQPHASSSQPKTMADVLALPEAERKLMNWLMRRRKASLTEITNYVGGDLGSAQVLLEQLFQASFITTLDESGREDIIFKPKIVSRR